MSNSRTYVDPASDPRLSTVALPPDHGRQYSDPPRHLFPSDAEAPTVGRLHYDAASFDATTEEQIETLDLAEAVDRLVATYGVQRVSRVLALVAMARGEKL